MPRKPLGIVGYGYVGKATHFFFKDHYDVLVHDTDERRCNGVSFASREEINGCELSVVCVPTPASNGGGCDLSSVETTLRWVKTPLILLKSTVPVGTTDRLILETKKNIVFSPEFCGESSYWTPYRFHADIRECPFYIFGGAPMNTRRAVDYYVPVAGPVKTYRQTTARAAEMVKYVENSFYATKVTFCYELAAICEALHLDYYEIRDLWLLDPRVNPMHTAVFPENAHPFSGKCLPKDLSALIQSSKLSGYDPLLLEEVAKSNERLSASRRKGLPSRASANSPLPVRLDSSKRRAGRR